MPWAQKHNAKTQLATVEFRYPLFFSFSWFLKGGDGVGAFALAHLDGTPVAPLARINRDDAVEGVPLATKAGEANLFRESEGVFVDSGVSARVVENVTWSEASST